MTAPRGARDGLGGDSLSPAVIKGGILIFVALMLGAFLLWRGLDQDSGEIAAGDDVPVSDEGAATTIAGSTDATGDGATTTSITPDARPNSEVTVMVANGSGISGAAGLVSDDLTEAGYATTEPDNAEFVDTTTVYFVSGDEWEGLGVALTLGLDVEANPDVLQPMPDPAPVPDLRGATVLVIVGPDLA